MNLFKVLLVSWLIGVSLPYLNYVDIAYELKRSLMAWAYFILAAFCYKYILIELRLKNKFNVYIISALCFCMVISSLFNYLLVSPDIYDLLINAKRGDGLSWKNIYKSVELIALLTVGRNGIIYLYNRIVCGCRRLNVIITNNSTYNIGR